jgi:Na+/alanine symporter
VISTIILSLLLLGRVPLGNILPLFSNGTDGAIKGVVTFPVWFGDVSLLSVCRGRVKLNKNFVLKSLLSRFVSVFFVLGFSLIMFATYADITDLIDYGHNVSSMTQYSLGSHDYGRFDYIIYCFWMLAVFVKILLNFYTLSQNAKYVFNDSSRFIVPVLTMVVVYALTTFVFNNENSVYQMATSFIKITLLPVEFFLPLFVFILALIRYKKAKEESNATEKN